MANESDVVQQSNNSGVNEVEPQFDAILSGGDTDGTKLLQFEEKDEDNKRDAPLIRCNLNDLVADLCTSGRPVVSSGGFGDYTNIRTTLGPTENTEGCILQAPPQNSSFSFKHFLSSGTSVTAPSTTVTSIDSVGASTSMAMDNSKISSVTSSAQSLQTSTGARPKVPQSTSASTTSISSIIGGVNDSNASKMKRSPRFSSFDSQASLAEYSAVDSESGAVGGEESSSAGFVLYPDSISGEDSDFFAGAPISAIDRKYVPRSFSNYDMPAPPSSPRRRTGYNSARPNRLALNTNSSKLRLDLPVDNSTNVSRQSSNSGIDFPATNAAAAALPDFVQDHWMDSWHAHDMHINSPPNSPICDIVENLTGGGVGATGGGCTGVGVGSVGSCGAAGGNSNISNSNKSEQSGSSKMLPDFLSDGPIIHSSQRLADVAIGLPSNTVGSPDNPLASSQLSNLRVENERLQCEVNELRTSLIEQTQRLHDLDRKLQEAQRNNLAFKSQNISLGESSTDKAKKRTVASQNHITKLKQQVTQLTAELETLRRENEVLREEGAVGGCTASGCDRPYTSTADSSAGGNVGRPSRTQQISQNLRRAASNAESNLRQLLAGVENLRQMANDVENSEVHPEYDVSPDLFSDFLDECDDYEEFSGGPAL